MMKVCVVVVLCLMVQLSLAIVCLPNMCDNVQQPVLDCKGGVIKNGGFCGCTDICASVEGEMCHTHVMFGIPQQPCDAGLHCISKDNMRVGYGVCTQTHPDVDLGYRPQEKRQLAHARTRCEQMRMSSMISMVVYEGQWFAKCDSDGNFMPMQCDNTRHCFCVDTLTGQVQEGTKVLGTAHCS